MQSLSHAKIQIAFGGGGAVCYPTCEAPSFGIFCSAIDDIKGKEERCATKGCRVVTKSAITITIRPEILPVTPLSDIL